VKDDTKLPARAGLNLPGTLTRTSWKLPNDITFEQWVQCGRALQEIEGSVQWWIGDWWNANSAYGGRVETARDLDFNLALVRDYAWVSSNVSVRTDTLTFGHHRLVASLESKQQKRWLRKASDHDWSVNQLRQEIKAWKRELRQIAPDDLQPLDERCVLYTSSALGMIDELAPASIDWIITDPPYEKKFLPCYGDLGQLAAYALKPGGSCVVMSGQAWLPEVMIALCKSLTYHWAAAYLTPGGQAVQIFPRKVNTFWKPLLWFVKGEYAGDWIGDVCQSDTNDNEKRHQDWGQRESGMADFVERFTRAGDVILDPFLGGGTTGLVALKLNRRFIGSDQDAETITSAEERIRRETGQA